MKRKLLLYTLSLLLSLSACAQKRDWIMFRGDQGQGATATRLHPPLGIKWKLRLQPKPTYAFNNPVVLGDTIYFGSTDGNFYALDIESGYMRWVFKTKGAINSVPCADGQNIYFGANDGKVYAVSQEMGEEVWSFQADSTVQSTVVVYNNMVIFSSDGGTTYFLSSDGNPQFTLPNPIWHYDTFQIYRDIMYFAPGPLKRAHSFGAFDITQQAYLWVMDTAAMNAVWYSFPALKGDTLYMSTAANRKEFWLFNYYAFERSTGKILWKTTDHSEWGGELELNTDTMFDQNMKLLDYLAPAMWKNLLIYTSGDTRVRAFRAKSGALAWERTFDVPTSSAPTVSGNRVYFGLRGIEELGKQPRLICLLAKNGSLLWELELEGALLSAPVISGNWMIFGTDKNIFYTLEELF